MVLHQASSIDRSLSSAPKLPAQRRPFWAPTQGPNPTPIDTRTSQHGDRARCTHQLHEQAHLVDIRTRQTLKRARRIAIADGTDKRSEEHTSELQSLAYLV